jgi:hypothetical protein
MYVVLKLLTPNLNVVVCVKLVTFCVHWYNISGKVNV